MIALPSRRNLMLIGIALLLLLALVLGFRSPAILVDSAEVRRGPFRVIVEEEGRTRVVDRYQVFTPVSGHLRRVSLDAGDEVSRGDPLFIVNPGQASPLDTRSHAQAEAMLKRAESALESAATLVEAEQARNELAQAELRRMQRLLDEGFVAKEALERAESEARRSNASLRSARFSVDVARYERDNARAMLAFDADDEGSAIVVKAPVSGTVLRRQRQSEGAVHAGEPVLELGGLDSLEVEVDVLSPDAVRIRAGMEVELERWGGDDILRGRVQRVEPSGFTKISALGVEEQRVWVIVDLEQPREAWHTLGDAYRVEARFILWQGDDVLQVPASALFRREQRWGAYVVERGRAVYREVEPGRRSGLLREIIGGLEPAEQVVLHPGEDISDGSRVRLR